MPTIIQAGDLANEDEDQIMIDAATPQEQISDLHSDGEYNSVYSQNPSAPGSSPPAPARGLNYQRDVQEVLRSKSVQATIYMNDRKLLRGIVLHHYHDHGKCIRAVIDERPTRSRSKKPHTVLATMVADNVDEGRGHTYFVDFPDPIKKRDSEKWWFLRRCVLTEIFARFRPFKIQQYDTVAECCTNTCSCNESGKTMTSSHLVDTIRTCKYSYSQLDKEPGRGFYVNEQNDPGTVW